MTNVLPLVDPQEVSPTVRMAINRYMSTNGMWEPEEFAYWSIHWNSNKEILRFIAEYQNEERVFTAKQQSQLTAIAKVVCNRSGCDPMALEPGDAFGVDEVLLNGDPAHFMWREYMEIAEDVLDAINKLDDPNIQIEEK